MSQYSLLALYSSSFFCILSSSDVTITKNLNTDPLHDNPLVKTHYTNPFRSEACPDGIDVVWLWVNGSDPVFLKELEKNGKKGGEGRYRDYNTLFYSIRSVYEFAPYIKNYYIVTMNQIPTFINTSSLEFGDYKLRIVDHKEIFPKDNNLPVFNSNAIESMLHNIKNLSTCFLYLNDDMLLGKKLKPEHFVRNDGKFNIYRNGWEAPLVDKMKTNIWHQSVAYSNTLINSIYHKNKDKNSVKHFYPSHHCYFFNKNILREMESLWPKDFSETSAHKSRKPTDVVLSFLYGAHAVESKQGEYAVEKSYYYGLVNNEKKKIDGIVKGIDRKKPQCICLNDGLDSNHPEEVDYVVNTLTSFMDKYYPNPSPFEKYH
ncbi:Glycosyltransferase [Entamoeba marina]